MFKWLHCNFISSVVIQHLGGKEKGSKRWIFPSVLQRHISETLYLCGWADGWIDRWKREFPLWDSNNWYVVYIPFIWKTHFNQKQAWATKLPLVFKTCPCFQLVTFLTCIFSLTPTAPKSNVVIYHQELSARSYNRSWFRALFQAEVFWLLASQAEALQSVVFEVGTDFSKRVLVLVSFS